MSIFHVGRCDGTIQSTKLRSWRLSLTELEDSFSRPVICSNKQQVPHFLRCDGTKRNNVDVSNTARLLIIDADSRLDNDGKIQNGSIDPQLVHELLCDFNLNHVIYTSHSNNIDLHKWRAILPCKYDRSQLDALLWRVFQRLHENELAVIDAKENHTWSQAFFVASCPPERQHLFKSYSKIDGVNLDVERICAEYTAKFKPVTQSKTVTVTAPPVGALNPIKAFNSQHSIFEILTRNGYTKQGKRYLHPNSSSKIASVTIIDGKVFSHGGDVLNCSKALDAFDCFRLLECNSDMKTALNWNSEITKSNQRAFYGK